MGVAGENRTGRGRHVKHSPRWRVVCPVIRVMTRKRSHESVKGDVKVLPVVQEQLIVEKQRQESGRVAVHVTTDQRQEHVDIPLIDEQVEIERVPINQPVNTSAPVRQEGDVTVVSVYEERLVVHKQLVLKEEIRIRTRRTTHHAEQEVTIREETAHILRAGEPIRPAKPND